MLRIPFCICILLLSISGSRSKAAVPYVLTGVDKEAVHVLDDLPAEFFDFNSLPDLDELIIDGISQSQPSSPFTINTDLGSFFLGVFFGLMTVRVIYNLLLCISLKGKTCLLYVGTATFTILTTDDAFCIQ